jgi:hypothetical protein
MSNDVSPQDIHPSLRASFVPLPSDPNVPLTKEQLDALFSHPEAWKDLLRLHPELQFQEEPASA